MFDFRGSCWLTPSEQQETIERLVNAGLIKWSNNRDLPLKMGGKTDVYINLRDMRNNPDILRYLAELYANPLRRLRAHRFAEVPDAVSHLAGVIEADTNIPGVTIREEAKTGRVVSGNVIGHLERGWRVPVIDDVITDGKSKVVPLQTLRAAGVSIPGLVVMVDRQQGWQENLLNAGFGDVGVWPAMTLHDVRKYLIDNQLMQRCNPEVEAKNPLIVALDGKSWDEVLPLADQLRPTGCILKVNDLLFWEGAQKLLPDLSVYGRVMVDPKWHDIPATVANYCKRLRSCPPWAVTVHASGGDQMVREAKQALWDMETKVLAVTVLTSIDPKTCEEVYLRQPLQQVLRLAELVKDCADGFVCSPQEVAELRQKYPGKLLVVPGIRSDGKELHDQQRVGTPKGTMDAGANHLVMGRQILENSDPVAEVHRILRDELDIKL